MCQMTTLKSLTTMHCNRKLNAPSVLQIENEKGRAPGRALCAKWAREGVF